MQAQASCGVCHLVVILKKGDERTLWGMKRWHSPALLLPVVPLALVEISVLSCGHQLLRGTQIVRVVGFVAAGKSHDGRMMKIVIPKSIDSVAALVGWFDQLNFLRLIFTRPRWSYVCRRLLGPIG